LACQSADKPVHPHDERLIATPRHGLIQRGALQRELLAVSADDSPASIQRDLTAQRAFESEDYDSYLVVQHPRNSTAPGEPRDPRAADLRPELVGEYLCDAILERLGPAVVGRDLDLIGAGSGHDLCPIQIAWNRHRADADCDAGG